MTWKSTLASVILKSGAATCALAAAGAAFAQETPAAPADETENRDIVVTGTLIRGIAPPGTNAIGVSQQAVQETGAATVSQLLQTIPQVGSFNSLQRPTGGGNFNTTNRPNLRGFPGFTTTGGSPTLMLVDGHRVVGMGISATSPDADIVPPGVIARVEIVPDGGSAIYGSDAVAGVINFITRKDIDGVEADGRYGFADNYYQVDGNLTVGKRWEGGGVYASYNFVKHDSIYGRDRDWVRTYPANRSGFGQAVTEVECAPGNVNVRLSPDVYGLPFTTATAASKRNVINQCDLSDSTTFYPSETRHSVFAGLDQQLSDRLKFEVSGFYMKRKMYLSLGQYHGNNLVGAVFLGSGANIPVPGGSVAYSKFLADHRINSGPGAELQNVYWAYGDDEAFNQDINVEGWGLIPTFTYDLGGGWQARAQASYGESISEQHSTRLNTTALSNAINAGLFNPYDPASSDAGALAVIENYENFGLSRQRQFDAKLVLDGELFSLPGGGVKLAVGAEYLNERFIAQRGDNIPGAENGGAAAQIVNGTTLALAKDGLPINNLGRTTKAVFGELVVPLFGADNATGGMRELTFSASGRYDHYSDFGGTFNPKFGLTWRPIEWVKFRGAWGKSFAAPSLADDAAADPVGFNWASGGTFSFLVPTSVLVANGYPAPAAGQNTLVVMLGGRTGLKPQKATTWTLGADIDPPFIPGLRLSGTYYNIKYNGLVTQPGFTNPNAYFATYKDSFIVNPTQAQIDAALAVSASTIGSPCSELPTCVYLIEDNRKANLGRFWTSGLDFAANYNQDTGFGSVDLSVNGNYELTRKESATSKSPFTDMLAGNNTRFRVRSSIGAWIGNFRAQATWNHTAGYKLTPAVPAAGEFPAQTRIKSFNVFDLFFKYDFKGEGLTQDLAFTLSVNNVLDQDPPAWRAQQIVLAANGFANGSGTIGRLVQFGVSKKF